LFLKFIEKLRPILFVFLKGGELLGDGGYLDGSFDAVLDHFFLGHFMVANG
jgi:hypothetical protein